MRNEERQLVRRKLDKEMRYYRLAARCKRPTQNLLRAVRHALGVPVAEIARELKLDASVLFRLEQSEKWGTISMGALSRVAQAMGCKVVYAVIPRHEETLEEMAERRYWQKHLRSWRG
jgi:hypothetical protein